MESNVDMCEPGPAGDVHRWIRTSWKPQSSGSSQTWFQTSKIQKEDYHKIARASVTKKWPEKPHYHHSSQEEKN